LEAPVIAGGPADDGDLIAEALAELGDQRGGVAGEALGHGDAQPRLAAELRLSGGDGGARGGLCVGADAAPEAGAHGDLVADEEDEGERVLAKSCLGGDLAVSSAADQGDPRERVHDGVDRERVVMIDAREEHATADRCGRRSTADRVDQLLRGVLGHGVFAVNHDQLEHRRHRTPVTLRRGR
jgi:hypothetical protein